MTSRGTGAGGANTNANGLAYEALTEIKCDTLKRLPKGTFHKVMTESGHREQEVSPMHGCRQPDEAYLDEENKKLFITTFL